METKETALHTLSLEEKTSLLSGKDFWQTMEIAHAGIPGMFLADGPHGMRRQAASADHLGLNASIPATCFPTAAALANSWDPRLLQELGRALGTEAAAQKVNVVLGPGLNIKRNPLCGRNFEYYSEDPVLGGTLAAAYVRGIQSVGVAACLKHFAANNQETRRMSIDARIDERTLREIYLAGFEIAVRDGNPLVVMSSYNRINGEYANENRRLLRSILRDEWGFSGVVVTDWGGSNERVAGLLAGSDLEMPGTRGESDRELLYALGEGLIDERLIDESAGRLVELARATRPALDNAIENFDKEAHHLIARRAAEESIVLLKNDEGILPLQKEARGIAVIGDFAFDPRYQGAGSSNVNPTKLVSPLDALREEGLALTGAERGFHRFGRRSPSLIRRAVELARQSSVVLLYIGLDEASEAEGLDRTSMELPANQQDLIEALHETGTPIVAVLSCGAVIEMPWIDKVQALVHGYLGGQAGAQAMAGVLSGRVNPSGKIAESYPLRYEHVSSAANFPGGEQTVEYREGLFVGYRYFDRKPELLRFPFGFGLSYTSFDYRNLQLSENVLEFDLVNTGRRAGSEIVQLYISLPGSSVFRPEKELKAFGKYQLEAGASVRVKMELKREFFRFFNVRSNSWDVEEGEYLILVGASSRDIRLEGKLGVEGNPAEGIYDSSVLSSYFEGDPARVSDAEFRRLYGADLPAADWDRKAQLGYNDTIAQCRYAKSILARIFFGLLVFTHWFLKKIGKRDAANLIMMSFYNMPFRGMTKMLGGAVSRPMVEGILTIINGKFFKGLGQVLRAKKQIRKEAHVK